MRKRNWTAHFRALSEGTPIGRRSADFGAEFGIDSATYKAVQAKLNADGANPKLAVDGAWGPMSQAAAKAWQAAHGLTPDGIPGPNTQKAMGIVATVPTKGTLDIVKVPMQGIEGLSPDVTDYFMSFTGKLEGDQLTYMYTDSMGLLTTGSGNLIDAGPRSTKEDSSARQPWNLSPALALPWKKPDGSRASSDEIMAAAQKVKAAWPSVQSTKCAGLTTLRLDKSDVAALVRNKLVANHQELLKHFPSYTSWPADAQLGAHSAAWAMGAAFANTFKDFTASVNRPIPDFVTASQQIHMSNGAADRNSANEELFMNAAHVQEKGLDKGKLYYPDLLTEVATVVNKTVAYSAGAYFGAGAVFFIAYKAYEYFTNRKRLNHA